MSAKATKPQPFDVDAASLSMTPEQFRAAYDSAMASGAEIYASPITFKRLYGDEADAKIESFKSRKNHKLVAKRGVSPKDIDRQHEEYLKAGYNLEYDVSDLSDDPVEVGRNLKRMVGTGYGARIDLAQIKQAYGEDWANQANKALRHGINLYERMKFEDAVRLVPAAEVAAPDKMASAHGKEPGPLGSDEMAPAHPVRNPERMLYVAVNVPDASQGRGTARLYFSAKLAKDREQEWSEITGKRSDVFLLPAKLFPDDAKVKVGAAEVARDKWIEMDNRDMPPEMRPWEQAKHRFTIDGRSRQSHDTKGQLDWNSEEGQKNIQAALDSYQTNVLDKTFLIGGATVAALKAARDTLGLLSASAKSDRQALGQLREYEAKDATGLIRMGTVLGAVGLASVERFAGSMRNIWQMFIDLGHPDQVRLIHDAAMRYMKPAVDAPMPFNSAPNPFASFLRRIREKAVENAKGGKVSLWDAVTDVAEEDFAPLMKVANAAITVPFFKAIAGFEAFDAFVYAFGKGLEQGSGEEVVPVVEELPLDVPYGQLGVEYELDYAKQVGLKMLSAPAATVFSTGNYMYRMLRAAGFKEGFAAEAEAIAAIVGMHLAGKHVKQAVVTAGAQIRDWAALKLAEGRWERTAKDPEVVSAARDFAKDVMKIETADQMSPEELSDTVTKKQKMQIEAIEEQKKKEAQDAFDAIAKAEEQRAAEEAKPEAAVPVEEVKQEVPVAKEVRGDEGQVQKPGVVEQGGQEKGSQDIPGDQEAGRGEPAPGEKRTPEEVAGEISKPQKNNTVLYHRTSAEAAAKIVQEGLRGAHAIETIATFEGADPAGRAKSLLTTHKGNNAVVVLEIPFSGKASEISENLVDYNVLTTKDPSLLHKTHIKGWYDLDTKTFHRNPNFDPYGAMRLPQDKVPGRIEPAPGAEAAEPEKPVEAARPGATPEKPFGDVPTEDESRYYGTRVELLPHELELKKNPDAKPIETKITRVLNNGKLLEVEVPDSNGEFTGGIMRFGAERIRVLEVKDAGTKVKPAKPPAQVTPKEEIVTPEPVGTPLEEVQKPVQVKPEDEAPRSKTPFGMDKYSSETRFAGTKVLVFSGRNKDWMKGEVKETYLHETGKYEYAYVQMEGNRKVGGLTRVEGKDLKIVELVDNLEGKEAKAGPEPSEVTAEPEKQEPQAPVTFTKKRGKTYEELPKEPKMALIGDKASTDTAWPWYRQMQRFAPKLNGKAVEDAAAKIERMFGVKIDRSEMFSAADLIDNLFYVEPPEMPSKYRKLLDQAKEAIANHKRSENPLKVYQKAADLYREFSQEFFGKKVNEKELLKFFESLPGVENETLPSAADVVEKIAKGKTGQTAGRQSEEYHNYKAGVSREIEESAKTINTSEAKIGLIKEMVDALRAAQGPEAKAEKSIAIGKSLEPEIGEYLQNLLGREIENSFADIEKSNKKKPKWEKEKFVEPSHINYARAKYRRVAKRFPQEVIDGIGPAGVVAEMGVRRIWQHLQTETLLGSTKKTIDPDVLENIRKYAKEQFGENLDAELDQERRLAMAVDAVPPFSKEAGPAITELYRESRKAGRSYDTEEPYREIEVLNYLFRKAPRQVPEFYDLVLGKTDYDAAMKAGREFLKKFRTGTLKAGKKALQGKTDLSDQPGYYFSRQIPGEGADRPANSLAARTPVELTEPVIPDAPTVVQLPEVFKLTKVLVRSLWPDLAMSRFLKFAEKLPGDAFGMFKQQYRRGERATSTITLKEELLEATTSLSRTLAHELGHFLQYFIREKPQLDPKDKGGAEDMLLDVAGKFELPGGKAPWDDPGRYPDADLAELKGAAESMRTENNNFGNVYQDFRSWEVPFRKRNAFKNLPDEIKKFWQEVSPEDRVETYNAVLRGVDAPYFDLTRMRTERPAADAVFERMMLDQINRLYELRQSPLYQELKDVARTFTPFDEAADAEVTAYRYSPSELWAEFVSAILTAPHLVKRTAPRLTLEWMEWANQQKPEFYDWWAKFSGFTEGDGAAFKSRMLDVGEGYDLSQDAKRFQVLMKFDEKGRGHMGPLASAAKLFVDRNEFIWQKLKKQYLLDRVDPNKSPMVALAPIEHYVKAMSYLDAHAAPYIYHLFNKIHRTFSDAWVNDNVSLSLKELHEFMFLKRTSEEKYYKKVTKEDPETGETTTETVEKQIPQSGLLQPKFAKSTLDYFKEQIGEKKSAYYEDLFTSWQALRQKYVIPAMERSEAWADDHPFLQKARTNAVYGKFSSLDVIMEAIKMYGTDVGGEMFGGSGNLASMLHGRKGNVGGVADIPSETFEQDIQILRMARRMELRRKYVEEMYKYAPDMLQAGSARYPDWRKLTIHKGGEKIDIWMDPRFHEAMVRPDVTMSGMERLLELINYPYKNAFVKYNLAFSVFNTVRDYNSSVLKLPQARRFVDLPWGIIQMLPEGLREMAMEKTGIRFNRSLARYFLPAAEKALRETKYLEGEKVEYPIELEDMQMEGLVSSGNSWNSMIGIADLGNELNYLFRSIKDKVKLTAELLKINSGQKTLASSDVPKALKEHLLKTESLERDFQKFNLKLQNDPVKYHQEVSQPINNLIVGVAKDFGKFLKTAFQTIPKIARMSDRINKIVGYEYLMEHAGDIWRDVTPAEREALIYNAVRERAGSPDFRTKGLAYAFYNNLFLFSNAGIQGVNSLYSAFKDNPYDTAWKMAMYNVGPKILMYYLYQGAIPFEFTEPFSGTTFNQDDLKKVLQKIPTYILARYRIIPIAVYGMGAEQELFFATLPSSFEGEAISMLTWAGLEAGMMEWAGAPGTGNVSNVVKTLDAIQPFASEAPALKTVKNFAEYFGYNINPYNPYTGKGVIPYQEFMDSRVALQKGGVHALRWAYTSRWIAYDMLNSLLGGFVYRPSDMVELAADKLTGDPADKLKWDMMTSFKRFGVAVGPAFGRIFRSTNAGEKRLVVENSIREENENFVKRQESRREIDAKLDGLPKMKGHYPRITAGFIKATAAELKRKDAAYKDPDDLKEYLRRKMWAESGVPILMDVARARSTKGVVARLKKIHPDTTESNYKAKLNKIEREVFGYDLP